MLADAIDTYYEYVKTRLTQGALDSNGNPILNDDGSVAFPPINTTRGFAGYADAQAWPPDNIKYNTFYLVITNQFPEPKWSTRGDEHYRATLQWTWVTEGTDLTGTTTGQNRGNRFRLEQQIREELRQANFPGFCPLITVTQNPSGQIVRTPYNPVRMCRWTPLSFGPRPSAVSDSGVLYGAAAVDVYSFQQPLSQ